MEDFIQLSLFGRMYQEHSAATEEKTSAQCWKNWPALSNPKFQSLDLRKENGQKQALSAEMDGALRGELSTLNIGEFPSAAVESRLSWILEVNVPEKYYLSELACQGILNRASRRGKALPEILHTALLDMIEWWKERGHTLDTLSKVTLLPPVRRSGEPAGTICRWWPRKHLPHGTIKPGVFTPKMALFQH